jgi:CheY-like chemotaxis protein
VQTILVVEDEWAIADWLQALLDDQGYAVVTASNGRQALELISTQKPDLILTDFMMPLMDGAALLQAVRRAGYTSLPVVIISSLPEATIQERCPDHQGFLRKPFRERELLALLGTILGEPPHPR